MAHAHFSPACSPLEAPAPPGPTQATQSTQDKRALLFQLRTDGSAAWRLARPKGVNYSGECSTVCCFPHLCIARLAGYAGWGACALSFSPDFFTGFAALTCNCPPPLLPHCLAPCQNAWPLIPTPAPLLPHHAHHSKTLANHCLISAWCPLTTTAACLHWSTRFAWLSDHPARRQEEEGKPTNRVQASLLSLKRQAREGTQVNRTNV